MYTLFFHGFLFFSPTEERLFANGWKDNCYFFGDSDSFVTNPAVTARERMLLRQTESMLRGLSLRETTTVDETDCDDAGETVVQMRSEEDWLLPDLLAPCLLALPLYLQKQAADLLPQFLARRLRCDPVFDNRREAMLKHFNALIAEYVFPFDCQHPSHFFRGVVRVIDPLVYSSDSVDEALYLDFLPMLRVICAREQIELATTKMKGQGDTTPSARKRKTRNSSGDDLNFLASLSPAFKWNDERDKLSAPQVSKRFADRSLNVLRQTPHRCSCT
jgi:hypothetical protein